MNLVWTLTFKRHLERHVERPKQELALWEASAGMLDILAPDLSLASICLSGPGWDLGRVSTWQHQALGFQQPCPSVMRPCSSVPPLTFSQHIPSSMISSSCSCCLSHCQRISAWAAHLGLPAPHLQQPLSQISLPPSQNLFSLRLLAIHFDCNTGNYFVVHLRV